MLLKGEREADRVLSHAESAVGSGKVSHTKSAVGSV